MSSSKTGNSSLSSVAALAKHVSTISASLSRGSTTDAASPAVGQERGRASVVISAAGPPARSASRVSTVSIQAAGASESVIEPRRMSHSAVSATSAHGEGSIASLAKDDAAANALVSDDVRVAAMVASTASGFEPVAPWPETLFDRVMRARIVIGDLFSAHEADGSPLQPERGREGSAHMKVLQARVTRVLHQLADTVRVDDSSQKLNALVNKSAISRAIVGDPSRPQSPTGQAARMSWVSVSEAAPDAAGDASTGDALDSTLRGASPGERRVRDRARRRSGAASETSFDGSAGPNGGGGGGEGSQLSRYELMLANLRLRVSDQEKHIDAMKAFCVRKDRAITSFRETLLQDVMNLRKDNIEVKSQLAMASALAAMAPQTAGGQTLNVSSRSGGSARSAAHRTSTGLPTSPTTSPGLPAVEPFAFITTVTDHSNISGGSGNLSPRQAAASRLMQLSQQEYITMFDYLRLFEGDDPDPERLEGGVLRIAERAHRDVVQRLNIEHRSIVLQKDRELELLRREIGTLTATLERETKKAYVPANTALMGRLARLRGADEGEPEGVSGEQMEQDIEYLLAQMEQKNAEIEEYRGLVERSKVDAVARDQQGQSELVREQQAAQDLIAQLEEREAEVAEQQSTISTLRHEILLARREVEESEARGGREASGAAAELQRLRDQVIPTLEDDRDALKGRLDEALERLEKLGAGGEGSTATDAANGNVLAATQARDAASAARAATNATKQLAKAEADLKHLRQDLEEERARGELCRQELNDLKAESQRTKSELDKRRASMVTGMFGKSQTERDKEKSQAEQVKKAQEETARVGEQLELQRQEVDRARHIGEVVAEERDEALARVRRLEAVIERLHGTVADVEHAADMSDDIRGVRLQCEASDAASNAMEQSKNVQFLLQRMDQVEEKHREALEREREAATENRKLTQQLLEMSAALDRERLRTTANSSPQTIVTADLSAPTDVRVFDAAARDQRTGSASSTRRGMGRQSPQRASIDETPVETTPSGTGGTGKGVGIVRRRRKSVDPESHKKTGTASPGKAGGEAVAAGAGVSGPLKGTPSKAQSNSVGTTAATAAGLSQARPVCCDKGIQVSPPRPSAAKKPVPQSAQPPTTAAAKIVTPAAGNAATATAAASSKQPNTLSAQAPTQAAATNTAAASTAQRHVIDMPGAPVAGDAAVAGLVKRGSQTRIGANGDVRRVPSDRSTATAEPTVEGAPLARRNTGTPATFGVASRTSSGAELRGGPGLPSPLESSLNSTGAGASGLHARAGSAGQRPRSPASPGGLPRDGVVEQERVLPEGPAVTRKECSTRPLSPLRTRQGHPQQQATPTGSPARHAHQPLVLDRIPSGSGLTTPVDEGLRRAASRPASAATHPLLEAILQQRPPTPLCGTGSAPPARSPKHAPLWPQGDAPERAGAGSATATPRDNAVAPSSVNAAVAAASPAGPASLEASKGPSSRVSMPDARRSAVQSATAARRAEAPQSPLMRAAGTRAPFPHPHAATPAAQTSESHATSSHISGGPSPHKSSAGPARPWTPFAAAKERPLHTPANTAAGRASPDAGSGRPGPDRRVDADSQLSDTSALSHIAHTPVVASSPLPSAAPYSPSVSACDNTQHDEVTCASLAAVPHDVDVPPTGAPPRPATNASDSGRGATGDKAAVGARNAATTGTRVTTASHPNPAAGAGRYRPPSRSSVDTFRTGGSHISTRPHTPAESAGDVLLPPRSSSHATTQDAAGHDGSEGLPPLDDEPIHFHPRFGGLSKFPKGTALPTEAVRKLHALQWLRDHEDDVRDFVQGLVERRLAELAAATPLDSNLTKDTAPVLPVSTPSSKTTECHDLPWLGTHARAARDGAERPPAPAAAAAMANDDRFASQDENMSAVAASRPHGAAQGGRPRAVSLAERERVWVSSTPPAEAAAAGLEDPCIDLLPAEDAGGRGQGAVDRPATAGDVLADLPLWRQDVRRREADLRREQRHRLAPLPATAAQGSRERKRRATSTAAAAEGNAADREEGETLPPPSEAYLRVLEHIPQRSLLAATPSSAPHAASSGQQPAPHASASPAEDGASHLRPPTGPWVGDPDAELVTTLDIRRLYADIFQSEAAAPEDMLVARKDTQSAAGVGRRAASGARHAPTASVRGVRDKVKAQINVARFMQTFPTLHPALQASANSAL